MMTKTEVLNGLTFLEKYAPENMRDVIRMARSGCEAIVAVSLLDEIRERPADDLEVSVACGAALGHLGLKTIRDVEEFAWLPDDVILQKGKKVYFGKKRIKEVREVLTNIGLGRRNAQPA